MTLRIIKTLLGCALAIGIWCIGINLYLDSKQDKLKQDIYSQIDNILAGQNIIMDVLNYSVETEKVPMPEILKKNESSTIFWFRTI